MSQSGTYICHEDGLEFNDLEELQRHLKSKARAAAPGVSNSEWRLN